MNEAILIKQFELGTLKNFIHLICNKETKDLVVIDPAWDIDTIRDWVEENNYRIKAILLTHGHADHIEGYKKLLETHDVPVYISKVEADFYNIEGKNIVTVEADYQYDLGGIPIDFIPTPGHTPGGQCFLAGGHLIAGDTLFIDGCGRCDMVGGDPVKMFNSIHNRLMKLPDSTMIYPGHYYHEKRCYTLANQKKTNPYMLADKLEDFVARRMPSLA